MLLELLVELLLRLEERDASEAQPHHVRGHHVREHVREAERRELVVVATRGSTELLEALELSLCLSEVSESSPLSSSDAVIYTTSVSCSYDCEIMHTYSCAKRSQYGCAAGQVLGS